MLLTVPFLYPIHDAPHDYQRYTLHGLIREFEAAGLQIEQVKPTLGAAETAGLTVCLALGGMVLQAVSRRSPAIIFIPLVIVLIPFVNLAAWLAGRLLPTWGAVTAGYEILAYKP